MKSMEEKVINFLTISYSMISFLIQQLIMKNKNLIFLWFFEKKYWVFVEESRDEILRFYSRRTIMIYCSRISSQYISYFLFLFSYHFITIILISLHIFYNSFSWSTEPSTKSVVPSIDITSAIRWLWQIILIDWKL